VLVASKSVWAMMALLLCLAGKTSLFAQTAPGDQSPPQQNPLQIVTKTLPDGFAGDAYEAQLRASGGAPPYGWGLDPQSKLPPGLTLSKSGLISGTPNLPGVFTFTIQLRDEGPPTAWVQLAFKITVRAAFAVVWRQGPVVRGNQILGQVVVYNNVDAGVDLTVVVVAVNEINKAFALGYERVELGAKSETKAIPFGTQMNLPAGNYVVHVDAIGEAVAKNRIYRARQQTPGALAVVAR
jgi:hypothetical protein